MRSVPVHDVPAGPLGVRWLEYDVEPLQAGALGGARVRLENAGAAPWHDVLAAYHWLDELGNAIFWDGLRTAVPPLSPGETAELELRVRGLMPPGRYRLAFDLVLEHRYWLSEIGNAMLETDVEVARRDPTAAVVHLPPGVEPSPDWRTLVEAAHEEGYAAVGGAVESRDRHLRAYRPGGGRNPSFAEPLICPSLLPPLTPNAEVAGLPAWRPEGDEPWIYDGRITVRLQSGRPLS
jgi:hypothetical protein